jgi:transposase
VNTSASGIRVERRRRRRYSAEFKLEAVAACLQPGVSIASAALARGLNANLLRRWIVEAEQEEAVRIPVPKAITAPKDAFVALPLPPAPGDRPPIQIEVRRGGLTLSVQWPSSALHECAIWLREVLK